MARVGKTLVAAVSVVVLVATGTAWATCEQPRDVGVSR